MRLVKETQQHVPMIPLSESVLRLRGAIRNLKEAIDYQNKSIIFAERAKLFSEIEIYKRAESIVQKNSLTSRLMLHVGKHEVEVAATILCTAELFLACSPSVALI